jgi:hypothetical protein
MGFGKGFGFGYGRGRGYGYGRGVGNGRGEFSGYSCVKFIFFGFNVLFWVNNIMFIIFVQFILQSSVQFLDDRCYLLACEHI